MLALNIVLENLDPKELAGYIHSLLLNSYGDLCSLAVFYLEYLHTLPAEVAYIWPGRWNSIKLFYFISRYTPFIDGTVQLYQHFASEPTPAQCTAFFLMESIFVACGILSAEGLLLFRTFAIWHNDKRLEYILVSLILALSVPVFYLAVAGGIHAKFGPNLIKSNMLPGCYVTKSDRSWLYMFSLFTFYETIVFTLTVYRAYQNRTFSQYRHVMFSIIYRDGILFYACLLAISIANITVMVTVKGLPSDSITLPHRVLHSILSARLILNLREAAYRRPEDSEDITTIAFSPVQAKDFPLAREQNLPEMEFSKAG